MALLGNYSVLLKSPGRFFSGSSVSDNRANVNTPGSSRGMFTGWSAISMLSAVPNGYRPTYSWVIAQKTGGLSTSSKGVTGTGNTGTLNLAGGLNAVGPLTGTGNISNASVVWLIIAAAALSGAATTNANITGVLEAVSALAGSASIASNLAALVGITAALSGSGVIDSAAIISILPAVAALVGSGDITQANLSGALSAVASLTGTGVTSATIKAIWDAISTLTGSSSVTAANTPKGNLTAPITGSSVIDGTSVAKAHIDSDINVTGDLLTTSNVAAVIWSELAEGALSYQDVQRILLAVVAGKTTIAGSTVTFRDSEDSKDRVTATMSGSERATISLDVS